MLEYDTYIDWKNWKKEDFLKFSELERLAFELEFGAYINKANVSKVLEVGFGNGKVLGWAKSLDKECEGVEVNRDLVLRAQEAGIKAYETIFDIEEKEKYDVIFVLDVLEHIEAKNLEAFFLKLKSILSLHGKVVTRFPNGDSPFALPTQNGDLTHVTPIGWHRISHLAQVASFDLVEYRGERLYSSSFFLQLVRFSISSIRYMVADFLLILFFPRIPKGTVTFRYVNILAVFKNT